MEVTADAGVKRRPWGFRFNGHFPTVAAASGSTRPSGGGAWIRRAAAVMKSQKKTIIIWKSYV